MNISVIEEIYEKLKTIKNNNNPRISLINDMLSYNEWYKELDNDVIYDILIYLGFDKEKALNLLKEIIKIKVC